MYKKLALAAFAVASLSAFAQNSEWASKYDTFHIGQTDLGGSNEFTLWKITQHDLKSANANDSFTINKFLDDAPADQSWVIVKAIAGNYKQASMVRDEVAQARFGTPSDYAWLSYPLLTWSATPGQNSWTGVTMTDTPPMTENGNPVDVTMSADNSRPMRMAMRGGGSKDINYDHTLDILGSGLNETERATLHEMFHPESFDPYTYTNEELLEALTRVVESNAAMIDGLGRYAWYNHFDKDYYSSKHWNW